MKTAKELVAEASTGLQTLSAEDALKLMGDPTVIFVDVREQEELQRTGKLRGAIHVPRGLLEFQVDPTSPTHKPELGGEKKLVLYCGSGGRSALGTKALKQMGMMNVAHVAGGFPALQKAGAPREEATLFCTI
jgi:rhodanese-related sulfurtransferase